MKRDWAHLVLLALMPIVAVMVAGSLIMSLVGLPAILSSRDNSEEVAKGTRIAACRANARVPFDLALADLEVAGGDLQVAGSEVYNVVPRALAAVVSDDKAVLLATLNQSVDASSEVDATAAALTEARRRVAEEAQRFVEVNARSYSDPEKFLREDCD